MLFPLAFEILIDRVQRVGLRFLEGASEFRLNSVYHVKEISTIHFEFSAAELVIGAEQKVIAENFMLLLVERSLRNKAEIRDELLFLSSPAAASRMGRSLL